MTLSKQPLILRSQQVLNSIKVYQVYVDKWLKRTEDAELAMLRARMRKHGEREAEFDYFEAGKAMSEFQRKRNAEEERLVILLAENL